MHIDEDAKRAGRESSGLLPIVMGVVLALGLLAYLAPKQHIDFEKIGLGIGTEERFGFSGSVKYHCLTLEDGDACISAVKANANMRNILWLGASQLHGINNPQPGDQTAVEMLHNEMLRSNTFLTSFSPPNANFLEHYVLFEYLRHASNVDVLVLGAVFDDMRERGIRKSILEGIATPNTAQALQETLAGRSILERYAGVQQSQSALDEEAIFSDEKLNYQQRVESYLNESLSKVSNVWAARADFRGSLVLAFKLERLNRWLFIIRNKALGIDSTKWTVRVDKSQYAVNRSALDAILESAQHADIPVLLYIVPRPIDEYFPYDSAAYGAFKLDMRELTSSRGAYFVNLEDAVVGDVWGTIDNGVGGIITDIFHFRGSAHKQLATGVRNVLIPILPGEEAQ